MIIDRRAIGTLFLLVFLPSLALAQTAAPTKIRGAASVDRQSDTLPPGTTAPETVGRHICPGYPMLAAQNLTSGLTELAFTITPKGSVSSVAVKQSSGNKQLDDAAAMCIKAWLYKPATRGGADVAVPWSTSIRWGAGPEDDAPGDTASDLSGVISVPVWSRGGFRCEGWYYGSTRPKHSVVLAFFVDPDGAVKDITVVQSSGQPEVDSDAVKCLSRRHYIPAKEDGKPIQVRISDRLY